MYALAEMKGVLTAVIAAGLLTGACKSASYEYEQRAAQVSESWALAVTTMDLYLATRSKTYEALANKAVGAACGTVVLFSHTDEPAEYVGTKELLMAADVGGRLTCQNTASFENQRDAADRWTAIMIENHLPLTVDD